jgi:hypothetical protein
MGQLVSASDRHFPPSWKADDLAACFVVKDSIGQELAYIYYEEAPGRRAITKLLTRDEAQCIALGITKLPELIRR